MAATVRIEKRDFGEFGGTFKLARANGTERGRDHYMYSMQYDHALLLRSYRPMPLAEMESRLLSLERKPGAEDFQYMMLINGSIRTFNSVAHLSLYGFTERAALVIDDELYAALPKGPPMGKDGEGGLGMGLARLENKLVAIINRRSKRSYYMVENATSHRFLNWDHFTSFNFTVEDAIPVNDAFFSKIPAAGFYRLPTAKALEGRLVSLGKAYYFVEKGHYCSFRDYDHFKSSKASWKINDAVVITDEILRTVPKGAFCA